MFDVRFMQNPYYVPELRPLSGLTDEVREFVLGQPVDRPLPRPRCSEFLDFAIPAYIAEGKTRLTIAIGCTGGYPPLDRDRRGARRAGCGSATTGPVAVFHRELDADA